MGKIAGLFPGGCSPGPYGLDPVEANYPSTNEFVLFSIKYVVFDHPLLAHVPAQVVQFAGLKGGI